MATHIEFGVHQQVETRHDSNQPTSICVPHMLPIFSLLLQLYFLITGLCGESGYTLCCIARAERDGTRPETRFRLSPKRTSPFKLAGASVQSTAGSRGARISLSNAGYTTFGGDVRVLATHSIRQFPLHFPSRASPVPPGSERALAPFERGIIAMVVLTLSLQIHE